MTTAAEDKQFIESVISPYLLEEAIAWIAKNIEPEGVFSKKALIQWAENEGMTKENNHE
jgi:hypothetical protein